MVIVADGRLSTHNSLSPLHKADVHNSGCLVAPNSMKTTNSLSHRSLDDFVRALEQ